MDGEGVKNIPKWRYILQFMNSPLFKHCTQFPHELNPNYIITASMYNDIHLQHFKKVEVF